MPFSQYGEEAIILEFFKGHGKGRLLDIGAGNGVLGSNSRKLLLDGWCGTLIEPHPQQFAELYSLYREYDRIELKHFAITADGRPVRFAPHNKYEQLSTTKFDHVRRMGWDNDFGRPYSVASVAPKQLADFGGVPFDFITIDAEGCDAEIIECKALFEGTKLLCYEHNLPGDFVDAAYTARLQAALAALKFTRIVGTTKGNTLVAR